jgi:hypothetical protein
MKTILPFILIVLALIPIAWQLFHRRSPTKIEIIDPEKCEPYVPVDDLKPLTEEQFEQFKKDLAREAGLTVDNESVFVGMEIYKGQERWTVTHISISHKEIQVANSVGKQMFIPQSELNQWTTPVYK